MQVNSQRGIKEVEGEIHQVNGESPTSSSNVEDDNGTLNSSKIRLLRSVWMKNKGVVLVLASQFFGVLMNVTTSVLENEPVHAMTPFQILLVRMSITSACSLLYMKYNDIPDAPLGKRPIRPLLFLRAFGGFFGVFGMYYSLQYLPLSDATVLTFLAPTVSCWMCSIFIRQPFTRTEQLCGYISLVGVILIAQPTALFSKSSPSAGGDSPSRFPVATPTQRMFAVCIGMIGVCGAASAYATIRWIGKRAHPLISVTYFSTWTMIVSGFVIFVPLGFAPFCNNSFRLPHDGREWGLFLFLGMCGFTMQFLLTAGLAAEKSGRATMMVYSQMLFAVIFDRVIWGVEPGPWSIAGSTLILGSAIWVGARKQRVTEVETIKQVADEESPLLAEGQQELD